MEKVLIHQSVAVLIDGNNMDRGFQDLMKSKDYLLDIDKFVEKVVKGRTLSHLAFLREGTRISDKLSKKINDTYFGTTIPCYKSADISLTIEAISIFSKVNTIIIGSGDGDYIPLVKYLKMNGVRVEIAGVKGSINHYLTQACDYVHTLEIDECRKIPNNEDRFRSLPRSSSEIQPVVAETIEEKETVIAE